MTSRGEARRVRIAMGTFVAIAASAPSAELAEEALNRAFAAVWRVDQLMHPRRDGSDLQKILRAAPGKPVRIDRETGAVLRLAKRIHALSAGAFDPCLPECSGRLSDLQIHGPTEQILADGADGALVTCHAPLALDLGGIAKGHAVDRAIEELSAAGCSAGLVNAGGDLRLFGPAQAVFLTRDGAAHPLELTNTALAVSDADCVERPPEHRGYYLRCTQSGSKTRPARQTQSSGQPRLTQRFAAVLADATAVADALTKCVLLCPPGTTSRLLRQFGARRVEAQRTLGS